MFQFLKLKKPKCEGVTQISRFKTNYTMMTKFPLFLAVAA